SLNGYALTGIFPIGTAATVQATAGSSNIRCNGCSAGFMASVGGDFRFASTGLTDPNAAYVGTAAVKGEVGYGKPFSGNTWTGTLGIPLTVRFGGAEGTDFAPFMTPAITFVNSGQVSADFPSAHGARFILEGGAAIYNAKSDLAATVGFQYVFVTQAALTIGIGVSYGGR